jgi:alpha-D-ribose 1-methylphosphonate 5-triphosphate synthase subunit PhnH
MLASAFADPVHASQRTFRAIMDALARPGTITTVAAAIAPSTPLKPAAAAIALTLLDYETPVWLDPALAAAEVADWLRFHTGAPITADPGEAAFAFVANSAEAPSFDAFALGSMDYPDRSTTLVLQVETFAAGESLSLSGPGIAGTQTFRAEPLPRRFREQLISNRAAFPRGVDVILAADHAITALPRSARVTDEA